MALEPEGPVLTYSEAEKVGGALCTRFSALTGVKPPTIKDEAWGDICQFVLRHAREAIARRGITQTEGSSDE